jgi:pimeloyl-ACP methyl ester carboxylesterase
MFDISSKQLQPTVTALAPGHPAFGIKGYRVVYKTHDELGNEVNASALVSVPVPSELILGGLKKEGKDFTISIVEDNHGTIFPDLEAPTSSVIATKKPPKIAVLFSGIGGFMTLQPDYIGYGQSAAHTHPYLLKKSSANTVIDLLKSAIKFGNDNSLPLNGQIFLTGYSEGGYVTLAAQEEIEKNHPELHLKGVVGMSGPYNLALVGMGVLSQPQIGRPDFIGAIINSYSQVYGYKLDEIINTQYASKLPTLYDKKKTGSEIMAELTHETKDFFTPTYRADFLQNDKNPLKVAFVKNSVDDFKPKTPTKLFYCGSDVTIPPAIALFVGKKMGIDAVDINSSLNHTQCAVPAYGATLQYFVNLRSK